MEFDAIVPAAGVGRRLGQSTPKQYLMLGDKTLLDCSCQVLLEHPGLQRLCVVIDKQDNYFHTTALAKNKHVMTAFGGNERFFSVLNGLLALVEYYGKPPSWVLVHDGARPFLSRTLLDTLLNALCDHEVGGLLAVPVADTIKRVDVSGHVSATQNREALWLAQTPQCFRGDYLLQALLTVVEHNLTVTDEAHAIEQLDLSPCVITGSRVNFKITTEDDWTLAKHLFTEGYND